MGFLCNMYIYCEGIRGRGGSERWAESQRHVIKDLSCCLCVWVLDVGGSRQNSHAKTTS